MKYLREMTKISNNLSTSFLIIISTNLIALNNKIASLTKKFDSYQLYCQQPIHIDQQHLHVLMTLLSKKVEQHLKNSKFKQEPYFFIRKYIFKNVLLKIGLDTVHQKSVSSNNCLVKK